MAEVIRMPKMSDTMTEGVIVEWHKKVGDAVKSGDILAEVETDKATMELENYVKGTLLYIGIEKGKAVPVDAVIAIIGQSGEDISNLLTASSPTSTPTLKPKKDNSEQPNPGPVSHSVDLGGNANESRVKASPLARRMAEEKGINLTQISGSGDAGRIVKRDIEQVNSSETPLMKSNEQDQSWDIPLSQMRKTIARRLSESKFSAPHFYLTMEINMDQAIAARQRINQAGIFKISLNDMVVQASARALRKHPKVNVSWMGDVLRQHQHIHVGVAMAIEDGLVVPVIRNTDRLGLSDISTQIKMLAEKAKAKKLQPEDFTGNTFTISNLGMYGIEEFTAIINPPDACILAVGTVKEIVVSKKGQFQTTQVMKVTLSCDHRAVDGAVGASFLQTLKNNLEDPFQMLI